MDTTEQTDQRLPTIHEVEWRDAKRAFEAKLQYVRDIYDTGSPLIETLPLLARMAELAMAQANRAYDDLQEHNASRLSPEHAQSHGVAQEPVSYAVLVKLLNPLVGQDFSRVLATSLPAVLANNGYAIVRVAS